MKRKEETVDLEALGGNMKDGVIKEAMEEGDT